MNPFYFGTEQRRLFGIYRPARSTPRVPRAALLCSSFGSEYQRAHRSIRRLGELLADAGHHVMRFDYFGAGDSAGDSSDVDVPGWADDVRTAADELKDMADVPRITVVGVRFGALLAAHALEGRSDVERMVLWDPVVSGSDYAAELESLAEPKSGADAGRQPLEVLGFPLPRTMLGQIAAMDLCAAMARPGCPAFVVTSAEDPSHSRLEHTLSTNARPGSAYLLCPDTAAWVEQQGLGAGAIPARLLERIVNWCK
jgi:uncharacterized protein